MDNSLIDSLNHPFCQQWRPLIESPKSDPAHIIIDDWQNIEKAQQAGCTINHVVSLADQGILTDLPASVERWTIQPRTLKKLFSPGRAPECFAIAKRPTTTTLDQLPAQDLVVLDGLRITGNIGAICRSIAALGPAALVCVNSDIDMYDRRIIRASRGSIFHVPVLHAQADELIAYCQTKNISLVMTSAKADTPVTWLSEHSERIALMVGSEKEGASDELNTAAQQHIHIPMHDHVESLNVSVATSICWYVRQQPCLSD